MIEAPVLILKVFSVSAPVPELSMVGSGVSIAILTVSCSYSASKLPTTSSKVSGFARSAAMNAPW